MAGPDLDDLPLGEEIDLLGDLLTDVIDSEAIAELPSGGSRRATPATAPLADLVSEDSDDPETAEADGSDEDESEFDAPEFDFSEVPTTEGESGDVGSSELPDGFTAPGAFTAGDTGGAGDYASAEDGGDSSGDEEDTGRPADFAAAPGRPEFAGRSAIDDDEFEEAEVELEEGFAATLDRPRPSDFDVEPEHRVIGSNGDDVDNGSDESDSIFAKKGDDEVATGGGDDIIRGGHGEDTLDGGAGMDAVNGGKGDDQLIYTLSENTGNTDWYDGDKGSDTLVLRLTTAEHEALADELAELEEFMADTANTKRSSGQFFNDASVSSPHHPVFETSFGLNVRNIENLEIEIVDEVPEAIPEVVPDPVPVPEPDPEPVPDAEPTVISLDSDTGTATPVSVTLQPDSQITLQVAVDVTPLPPKFDVMMLQDLTGSFWDDLPLVQELFPTLYEGLTSAADVQFGLGTFKDKPVPEEMLGGSSDYVYQTELAVTDDLAALTSTINGYTATGGYDWPEAQLEALAQAALRTEEIGYRDGVQKFAIVMSDAPPHIEGDYLGALMANDLDTDIEYEEDYPAIDALGELLKAAGLTPVFAVTEYVMADYQAIIDTWGFGSVTMLESDSSNLVDAVISGIEEATIDLTLDISSDDYGYVSSFTPSVYEDAGPGTYTFDITLEIPADSEDLSSDALSIAIPGYGDIALEIEIAQVDITGDASNDELLGDAGPNRIEGLDGDDTLDGAGGADTIVGGAGNDLLTGGLGDDVFEFADGDGDDTIADFIAGAGSDDAIDLRQVTSLANMTDVLAAAMLSGADTVIQISADQSITLQNVDKTDLHEDDFVF